MQTAALELHSVECVHACMQGQDVLQHGQRLPTNSEACVQSDGILPHYQQVFHMAFWECTVRGHPAR